MIGKRKKINYAGDSRNYGQICTSNGAIFRTDVAANWSTIYRIKCSSPLQYTVSRRNLPQFSKNCLTDIWIWKGWNLFEQRLVVVKIKMVHFIWTRFTFIWSCLPKFESIPPRSSPWCPCLQLLLSRTLNNCNRVEGMKGQRYVEWLRHCWNGGVRKSNLTAG